MRASLPRRASVLVAPGTQARLLTGRTPLPWPLQVPRPGRSQRRPARAPPPATAFLPARPLAPPSPSWDPHWVINSQRSCERLAEVVLSQRAAGLLSASDLGAALARAHALADPARPADRAATERLVALGWDQLGSLSYTPLVNLLLLSALCGQSTPQRMRAWVARAARDGALQDLPPAGWISLLEAACVLQRSAQVGQGDARGREAPVAAAAAGGHQAAAADGEQEAAVDGQQAAATAAADGEQTAPAAAAKAGPAPRAAFIPPRLLYTALRQTCCAEAAGRLSLRKLATLYSCAEELGLELSAAQHRSLCAAVQVGCHLQRAGHLAHCVMLQSGRRAATLPTQKDETPDMLPWGEAASRPHMHPAPLLAPPPTYLGPTPTTHCTLCLRCRPG